MLSQDFTGDCAPLIGESKPKKGRSFLFFFFKDFHSSSERRREGERERNITMWLPLMCTPYWGLSLQPWQVP